MVPGERFSRRNQYAGEAKEITIREEAPEGLRVTVLETARDLVGRRCCADTDWSIRPQPSGPSPPDAVGLWPAELGHPVQDIAGKDGLPPLPRWTARSKARADDQLVPEERVLYTGLPVVARHVLPPAPSHFLDRRDRAVTRARPRSPSRHVGRARRRDHNGRATRTGGIVEGDGIVGCIRRHTSEVAVGRLDQRDACRAIIDGRRRDGLSDDHPRLVHAEMQLPPASPASSSMFRSGPFPFPRSTVLCCQR